MQILRVLKTLSLDLLFPIRCTGCGRESLHLCSFCRAAVPRVLPGCIVCARLAPRRDRIPAGRTCEPCQRASSIYAFLSPYRYDTPEIRELIHNLKYQRVRSIADILGELLADFLKSQGVKFLEDTILLPLPLYPGRERVRGFNQSALIAAVLGIRIGIPVRESVLVKVRKSRPQIELSGGERRRNVAGSFAVRKREAIQERSVILLDDVKTTGATLEEAARVLKESGVKKVWAITVAR